MAIKHRGKKKKKKEGKKKSFSGAETFVLSLMIFEMATRLSSSKHQNAVFQKKEGQGVKLNHFSRAALQSLGILKCGK